MTSRKDTTLEVQSMTCGSCAYDVKHALAEVDGVEGVVVRLRQRRVVVTHAPGAAPVARLTEALRQAGYEAQEDLALVA